jgi:hypothetical protein
MKIMTTLFLRKKQEQKASSLLRAVNEPCPPSQHTHLESNIHATSIMMNIPCSHMAVLLLAAVRIETASARLYEHNNDNQAHYPDDETAASPMRRTKSGIYQPIDMTGSIDSSSSSSELDLPPPPQHESLIAAQFSPDPHGGRDHLSMIIDGELHLAGLRYSPKSFSSSSTPSSSLGGGSYDDVYGEFCAYDPSMNRKDPSSYATVSALTGESEHCGEHRYTMPLGMVVDAVRGGGETGGTTAGSATMRPLPVSGLLFHEGYSGAGLISNAIATFDAALIVSEHTALRDALDACDVVKNRYLSDDCSPEAQRRLVEDVVYLLARTSDPNVVRMYLKLPSSSSAYIPALRASYPEAKWTFVYRNAEHALSKSMERKRSGPCIKSRRNPSSALQAKSSHQQLDLEGLTNHEVCALHLSSLLDTATREHVDTGTGMLVSYDRDLSSSNNVDNVMNVILPYLGLGGEIHSNPEVVRERVSKVLGKRSNHVNNGGVVPDWSSAGGSAVIVGVSEEVRAASGLFMRESTEAMDDLDSAS